MDHQKSDVRKLAAAPDGSASPYQIIWSGYFPSVQALQDVMQNPASGEVMGDVPNYYISSTVWAAGRLLEGAYLPAAASAMT